MAFTFSLKGGQQTSWRTVNIQDSYVSQLLLLYSSVLHKKITVEGRLTSLNLPFSFFNMHLWPFFIKVNKIYDQVTFK